MFVFSIWQIDFNKLRFSGTKYPQICFQEISSHKFLTMQYISACMYIHMCNFYMQYIHIIYVILCIITYYSTIKV